MVANPGPSKLFDINGIARCPQAGTAAGWDDEAAAEAVFAPVVATNAGTVAIVVSAASQRGASQVPTDGFLTNGVLPVLLSPAESCFRGVGANHVPIDGL